MTLEIVEATKKAICPYCGKVIAEGKQVRANLGTGLYHLSYHIDCFKERNWGFIYDLMRTMKESEIEDLEYAFGEGFDDRNIIGDSASCADDCIGKTNPTECQSCIDIVNGRVK